MPRRFRSKTVVADAVESKHKTASSRSALSHLISQNSKKFMQKAKVQEAQVVLYSTSQCLLRLQVEGVLRFLQHKGCSVKI